MKRLLLFFAVLIAAGAVFAQGEGPQECAWGSSCAPSGGAGDIQDVFNCASGNCEDIVMGAGDSLTTPVVTADGEGIILGGTSTAACAINTVTDGMMCWDTDMNQLYIGDGVTLPQLIGPLDAVYNCETGDCNHLVLDDEETLKGPTVQNTATEGIFFGKNAGDCSASITEGQTCWDSTNDILYIGDGSGIVQIASGTGDITSVYDCTVGACTSMALADTEDMDFSGVSVTSATEGLFLPGHATACGSGTAEAQVCWDIDDNALYIGDSAAAKLIGAMSMSSSVIHPTRDVATADLAIGGVDDTADFFVDGATGNANTVGTVTAAGFVATPDTVEGGYTESCECEVGAGCAGDGLGACYKRQLRDSSDLMPNDKAVPEGHIVRWGVASADITAQATGDYCLNFAGGTSSSRGCSTWDNSQAMFYAVPYHDGLTVDKCFVMVWLNNHGHNDNKIVLQAQTWDLETGPTRIDIGDPFEIRDITPTTPCGATPNCADAKGLYVWDVNGSDDAAEGHWEANIDSTTVITSGVLQGYFSVECTYM